MRLRPALFACALLLTAPAVASAEVFVFPLPATLGTYPCAPACPGRTATFQLPGTPVVVHGASLHVTGTAEVGTIACDDGSPPPTVLLWPTVLGGTMSDPPNNGWTASADMPLTTGPFDWTAPFTTFAVVGLGIKPATWAFLSDGVGEITINGGPDGMLAGCIPTSPPPTLNLTGAWLLVDADIPVPAHAASWGSVKAIYR